MHYHSALESNSRRDTKMLSVTALNGIITHLKVVRMGEVSLVWLNNSAFGQSNGPVCHSVLCP